MRKKRNNSRGIELKLNYQSLLNEKRKTCFQKNQHKVISSSYYEIIIMMQYLFTKSNQNSCFFWDIQYSPITKIIISINKILHDSH